ncbi:hypothetical protein C8R44DRAFT_746558 [Mycena epipterygia]|nr:hypothetical protein C8R44DRAFT_746558 [Mycena epipterygia]
MPFNTVLNMTLALCKTYGINPRVFLLLSRQCSNSQPIKPFTRQSHSSISCVNTVQAIQLSPQQDLEASSLMILQCNIRLQVRIKPPKSAALSIPGIVLTLPHAYYTEGSSQHAPHVTVSACVAAIPQAYRTTHSAARFLPTVKLLTHMRQASAQRSSAASSRQGLLVVMDVDLQHPLSALPALLAMLDGDPDAPMLAPMVLGMHYGHGIVMDASWPMYHRLISWGMRILTRPLMTTSDPMTGFCTMRKDAFTCMRPLSLQGFKIVLELPLSIAGTAWPPEVPYAFSVWTVSTSKLGAKCMLGVLGHVLVGVGVADMVTVVRGAEGGGWRVVRVVGGEHIWRRFGGSGHRRRNGKGLLLLMARTGGRLE